MHRAQRNGKYRYFGAQGVIDYIDDYLFDGNYILIVEDLVQIITVFSCKLQGKRANKTKQMITELTSGDMVDDKNN